MTQPRSSATTGRSSGSILGSMGAQCSRTAYVEGCHRWNVAAGWALELFTDDTARENDDLETAVPAI